MSAPMNVKAAGDHGAGAGLNLAVAERGGRNDVVEAPSRSIASRALALSTYFLSGALCINFSQILGTPLYLINESWYNAWIAFTKQSFGLLTMTLTQTFSPTKVIVSGDASVRGQLRTNPDGTLLLDFPERLVLIANHQIYTDWLYLWWTAYCSGMHGRLYIVLKESLKKIPILGWGMQFSQFIFLKRDWEKDKKSLGDALSRLNKLSEPMWLMIFPEGTNLAPSTRAKSAKWAAKNGMKDMRHSLLPRSTGLRFILMELRDTTDWVYDCTMAYEGVKRGQYAQDIFTLRAGYIEGKPPKSVSMYWRRFNIKEIPIDNERAFDLWLIARWREKDLLIENYLIHGHFPKDVGISKSDTGQMVKGCGHLTVQIRSNHWYEFLQIFAPMGILAMVLYVFYGTLPRKMLESPQGKALKASADDLSDIRSNISAPTIPRSFDLDMIFDKDKQKQTLGNAGMALGSFLKSPEGNRLINNAEMIYKWLDDPGKAFVDSVAANPNRSNYMARLEEEENRRKKLANPHHGSFWHDLEGAEASKQGSSMGGSLTLPARKKKGPPKAAGTFYQDLQKTRDAKTQGSSTSKAGKGTFWDDMKKEEKNRGGTIVTLSSSAPSSNPFPSFNTTKTAPSTTPTSTRTSQAKKLDVLTTTKDGSKTASKLNATVSKFTGPKKLSTTAPVSAKLPVADKVDVPSNTASTAKGTTTTGTAASKPKAQATKPSTTNAKSTTTPSQPKKPESKATGQAKPKLPPSITGKTKTPTSNGPPKLKPKKDGAVVTPARPVKKPS